MTRRHAPRHVEPPGHGEAKARTLMKSATRRIRVAGMLLLLTGVCAAEAGDRLSSLAQAGVAGAAGISIPAPRVEAMIRREGGPAGNADIRRQIADEAVSEELVVRDAVRKGLHNRRETVTEMESAADQALLAAWVNRYLATHPIPKDAAHRLYRSLLDDAKEYKIRQVVVHSEAAARAILRCLKRGTPFSVFVTTDGDLPWGSMANFDSALGRVLASLKKGAYSRTPVSTRHGFHLLFLEDTRPYQVPPFEDLRT